MGLRQANTLSEESGPFITQGSGSLGVLGCRIQLMFYGVAGFPVSVVLVVCCLRFVDASSSSPDTFELKL